MIDKDFVDAIIENVQTKTLTVSGQEFASKEVFNPPLPREPLAAPLEVVTLTGLVDYTKAFIESGKDFVFHVRSYHEVALLSKIQGINRQRENLITANCAKPAFAFGVFHYHAPFMIAMQSLFMEYGDRAKVMKVIGTIRDESAKTSMDDGVTQRVTASAGIALNQEVSVPNPVLLKPYRTFLEIDQPPSEFVLRVQTGKVLPDIALFEADGGQWKREAVNSIREYLQTHTSGIAIVA